MIIIIIIIIIINKFSELVTVSFNHLPSLFYVLMFFLYLLWVIFFSYYVV